MGVLVYFLSKYFKQNFSLRSTVQKQLPEVFCKKRFLRNVAKFTGKLLCQSLFFNKVAGWGLQLYLKKQLRHKYFSPNLAKFLRTPVLQNISGRLLLTVAYLLDRSIKNSQKLKSVSYGIKFPPLKLLAIWPIIYPKQFL